MKLRNIAIIAHVDHGKTTLVDQLLRQSGTFRANQQVMERAMDSNDLERERGITILAKCTSVAWKGTRINIVDTPGHADFGGEVERILSMVDGVVVLVDAAEGPMPQTKFVTIKALAPGPAADRGHQQGATGPMPQPHEVHDVVFDLFAALGAHDEQLDFPTLFASSKQGWAAPPIWRTTSARIWRRCSTSSSRHVPRRRCELDAPFSMLATTLEYDPYLGRVLTGRIHTGIATRQHAGARLQPGRHASSKQARLTKLLAFRGLERVPVEEAEAGDIVAIAGLTETTVADTIADPLVDGADARPADRSADPGHDLLGQRQPARRPRGRQGDQPHDPRPPDARSPKATSPSA